MQSLTLESATEERGAAHARKLPRLHVKAFTGGLIVLVFMLVGIFGPVLAPHDPNKQQLTAMMKAPQGIGSPNALGTDNLGRDILSRVIHGSRVSLLIAFAVVFVSGFIGITLGAISGFFGGKVDFVIQKLVEVVWAFPPLLLGITIMAFLGPGIVQSDPGAGGATLDPLLPGRARADFIASVARFRHRGKMPRCQQPRRSSPAILFQI